MRVFKHGFVGMLLVAAMVQSALAAPTPQQTLQAAAQVLEETRALKVKSIPDALLADAQAVAVIPSVVKVGVIVGGRHGRGIVVVRDKDGAWTSPTFIELTGGSLGWQIGVQSSDVVLVFKNRQGVENLLTGSKFTLGADAAVAAGPVGRQASAATDEQLKAEVYSYSRSRGLFAGVALDGSVLAIDSAATASFQQGGEAAAADVARLIAALDKSPTLASGEVSFVSGPTTALRATQDELRSAHDKLQGRLPAEWRDYLAIPIAADNGPPVEVVETVLKRYDKVAADARYEALTSSADFQSTHTLLGRLLMEVQEASAVSLPPPPPKD
jgi:lipid-binding SYLF domain-containing protein